MSFDADMIRRAATRGLVLVDVPGRRPFTARLVCWRPKRTNSDSREFRARVECPSGGRVSVSCAYVHPYDEDGMKP